MLRITFILTTVALCAVLPIHAQHMNEKDSPCADSSSTADLVGCLVKAEEVANAKLNAAYDEVRRKLDVAELKQLVATQRLWIQYRDANCAAERDLYAGGTAGPPAYLACKEAMTRARTKELAVTYTVRLKK
jgi:uncharacterized protein YecT (DUF1311 family)